MRIKAESLTKFYGHKKVLTDVSLKIDEGKINVVLGPNGSGKTTLLRLLNLLEMPNGGKLFYDDQEFDFAKISGKKLKLSRRMAMVTQNPVMFNTTIFENVAYGLRVRGEKKRALEEKVKKALDLVKITHKEKQRALTLSGGEAQRVALARALVLDPEILFLDEPTNNLDTASLRIIEDLILKLKEKEERTVVLTTHLLSIARRWGEKFFVLKDGRIVQKGNREEIFNRPTSAFLAEFLGMENLFFGRLVKERENVKLCVDAIKFDVVASREGEVHATIPPEDILISQRPLSSSARNCFRGKVTHIEDEGAIVRVKVDIGIPLTSLVTKISKEEMKLFEGKEVYLTFKASAIHLFGGDQI